jgi:predicted O-methyltransferase YrrM
MDQGTSTAPRPITPLYRPGEQFDISAQGLDAWRQSEAYKRVLAFYSHYPDRSLQSDEARAVLHHLIVMRKPERVLEIGTMYAGTTEVLARAVQEAGRGHVDTIDPYGADTCPPAIARFPSKLRERVTFSPTSSAMYFDEVISRAKTYDFVLIDGSHELEFATFDLDCMLRVLRPGGLVVLDNIEQVGPRFATRRFLEKNPDWIDVAGVVRLMDPAEPLKVPPPSFPDTKFYILQSPRHLSIGDVPVSFGTQRVDGGELQGFDLDLAAPVVGMLHLQAYVRTFGVVPSEELSLTQSVAVNAPAGKLRVTLDKPLHSAVAERDGLSRRIEIILAFVGDGKLALKAEPVPFRANYL